MGGGGIAFKKQRIWAFLITRPSDLCNQGGSVIACRVWHSQVSRQVKKGKAVQDSAR